METNDPSNALACEKKREEFEIFLSSIATLGAEEFKFKISECYPEAKTLFIGPDPVPELGENQFWCCECGCGQKDPILCHTALMSCIHAEKGLTNARIQGFWMSPCYKNIDGERRHYGLYAWDASTDEVVSPPVELLGDL